MVKKEQKQDVALVLRGKSIHELRGLATRFLGNSAPAPDTLNRPELIGLLSRLASMNRGLARELRKSSICIKPSFYLMAMSLKSSSVPGIGKAKREVSKATSRMNTRLQAVSSTAQMRGFQVVGPSVIRDGVFKFSFSWERVHWYWSPKDVSLSKIYGLRFGYAILDLNTKKAVAICQTVRERDCVVKILSDVYPVTMSPLVLTKPLLDQIGDFTSVKRAHYFVLQADANTPENITYADENLATIPLARAEENSVRSQRKQSFYRIPLSGSIVEQGVGATSDSGKLWIPREIPLDLVEGFGAALLGKVTNVLNEMTESEEYDQVMDSLGVARLSDIQDIKSVRARQEICDLIRSLANMLLKDETERPYNVSTGLAVECVPQYFQYPRLILTDPVTADVSYWVNGDRSSMCVSVKRSEGNVLLLDQLSKQEIFLSEIVHPLTGNTMQITDPLSHLDLIPTARTCEIVLRAIQHISSHMPKLANVIQVPFRVSRSTLRLDLARCHGRSGPDPQNVLLSAEDISEFQRYLTVQVTSSQRSRLKKRLIGLGEKCQRMSDENCRSCVSRGRELCLRSLVGSFLRNPLILAHKGIELSDLQGECTIDNRARRVYGFFKIGRGKSGLTARNQNGAILMSQILGQVDKASFHIAFVVSPSAVNEDLRERLEMICSVFGKQLLILDAHLLAKLLLEYEDRQQFAS